MLCAPLSTKISLCLYEDTLRSNYFIEFYGSTEHLTVVCQKGITVFELLNTVYGWINYCLHLCYCYYYSVFNFCNESSH